MNENAKETFWALLFVSLFALGAIMALLELLT